MTDQDWTPARGYTIAACHLLIRSGIIVGLSVLAGVGFIKACDAMGIRVVHWALPFLTGAVSGAIEGYVLALNVADKCGLSGRTLLMPALVLFGVAQYLAYQATTVMYSGWGEPLSYLFAPAFAFGGLMAVKNFILDS